MLAIVYMLGQTSEVDLADEAVNVLKSVRKISSMLDAANVAVTTVMLTLAAVNPDHNKHVIRALYNLQTVLRDIQTELPQLRSKAIKLKYKVQNIKDSNDLMEAYEIANQLKSDIVIMVNELNLDEETLKALGVSGTAITALQEAILKASNTIDKFLTQLEDKLME